MKTLKILLWVTAVCCLVAFPFIFVPWSVIEGIGSWFGVASIPSSPFILYFFKVSCGAYGLIGVFFVILALNPFKYGPMLNLGAYGLMLFGVLALLTGISIGLHPVVYLGDGLSGLALGIAMVIFAGKAKQELAEIVEL